MPLLRVSAILLALFFACLCCFPMPKPPPHAVAHREANTTYYSGTVYLTSHDDTVKLKELGFRKFEYAGRSFGSLKYKAEWTRATASLPAPDCVNGITYDSTLPDNALIFDYFDDSPPGLTGSYPAFYKNSQPSYDSGPLFSPMVFSCVSRRG
jgi:hypothetical protein